ncbi:MAG: ornithine cyclodeaminase family protein [Armatimonadota bacterium]|nr:ornithine cyclodeaminase family protein [Armatimonadota bacterium]
MPARQPALRYLSRSDVEASALSASEILHLVTAAFEAKGKRQAEMPPKPGIRPYPGAYLHAMPAFLPRMEAAGVKWFGAFPDNLKRGLPYTSGLILLSDTETGLPLAVMDATWITSQRNGAVTALAARHLARPDSRTLGILGCGVQARAHVAALRQVLPHLSHVRAHDLLADHQQAFLNEVGRIYDLHVEGVPSPREVFRGSDVVVTTGSVFMRTKPPIEPHWLEAGGFGCALGLDAYWQADALRAVEKLCTDDTDQLRYYSAQGYFDALPPIHADLGEIVAGRRPGRESAGERILILNLGAAIADIAVAARVYQVALQKGLGTELPL